MNNDSINTDSIEDVSETMLSTLFSRAIESESKNPIINDPKSVEIARQLGYDHATMKSKLPKRLTNKAIAMLALRTKRFDEIVLDFLARHPEGIVVNIGCGLDTRFNRIDDGKVEWYDLDFPEVIEVKKHFFQENDRYHFIGSSVLDFRWIDTLSEKKNQPFLFIAGGVFPYLHEEEVKSLILKLQDTFPGCELVCEVVALFLVNMMKRRFWRRKMQRKARFGEDTAFNFGIKNSNDLESWNIGIQLLEDWFYLAQPEKKLGWMRFLGRFKFFRKTQWLVHYRLN